MKIILVLVSLLMSSLIFAQEVAQPDVKLLDAAIESYLKENKARFKFSPTEFIIEVADKAVYQNIKKQVGNTAIIIKTKKELQDYSKQKTGQEISFFVISISKNETGFFADIIDDGIKCTMNAGVASFEYKSWALARTCSLTINKQFVFQEIDCLLLPTDK